MSNYLAFDEFITSRLRDLCLLTPHLLHSRSEFAIQTVHSIGSIASGHMGTFTYHSPMDTQSL